MVNLQSSHEISLIRTILFILSKYWWFPKKNNHIIGITEICKSNTPVWCSHLFSSCWPLEYKFGDIFFYLSIFLSISRLFLTVNVDQQSVYRATKLLLHNISLRLKTMNIKNLKYPKKKVHVSKLRFFKNKIHTKC